MSNAAIHKTSKVLQVFRGYGYIAQLLPPYLPMLNPTEESSTKIKKFARHLKKNEIIADRTEEAAKTITAENCRG